MLSSVNVDHLSELLISRKWEEVGYLYSNPEDGVKSLALDLIGQLQPGIKSEMAEQVIKNLVFIARVLEKVALGNPEKPINLLWLTKRMRKIVNNEVVENPSNTVLRMEVFKWIAGLVTIVKAETIEPLVHHLLAPLLREMITTEVSNAPLRQLSKEVGKLIKGRIGLELYSSSLNSVQQHLNVKRAGRKRERNQLAVTDPEMYAQKKIKRHEKKKEAKKRKIVQMKGAPRKAKRRKVVDIDDNSDFM